MHCRHAGTMPPIADTPCRPSAAAHQRCRCDHCEQGHGKVYTADQGHHDECQCRAVVSTMNTM